MLESKTPESSLKDILVVQEFHNVFLEKIPGMPPPREVEFCIDLVSKATSIFKVSYQNGIGRA